ncbi:uncharacterized protein LOC127130160 [Lathyrus oleraceus]|uniref:uncharacterized protein LOC127130160 n=1 Tax=Pisum sativum TaxID=3888 RepID=UPI0021D355EB|nr:uncharacterized protein LOC127130160 [Pisum sativum]
MEGYQPIKFDFPYEDIMVIKDCETLGPNEGPEPGSQWMLVFDGALNAVGREIIALITFPTSFHIPFTIMLCFTCTSNMAKYKACILGINEVIDLRVKILEVYEDYVRKLITYFDEITFHYIPREENQLADALTTLASMFKVKWHNEAPSLTIQLMDGPSYCVAVETITHNEPWFYDIKQFLHKQEYPINASSGDKKLL